MKKITEITAPITPQKVANEMDAWVAMDKRGYWYCYEKRPSSYKTSWGMGGVTHSLDCIDIQWEGEWQDSLHEPELEILPGPDGECTVNDQTMITVGDDGTIATIDWTPEAKWKIEVPRKAPGFHRLQKANSKDAVSDVLFIQCAKVWVGALARKLD